MGNTPIYGVGFIEPNQDLSENIDLDELRFKSIEDSSFSISEDLLEIRINLKRSPNCCMNRIVCS